MRFGRSLLGAAALLAVTFAQGGVVAGGRETTMRRVRGIITAVDAGSLTITPVHGRRSTVTGRIDPARTHVAIDGRPARAADLALTDRASAELSLEDVWMTVRVSTNP
jgi:hypothetical protein